MQPLGQLVEVVQVLLRVSKEIQDALQPTVSAFLFYRPI